MQKCLRLILLLGIYMSAIEAKRKTRRSYPTKAELSCPIKEESMAYQCGRFVMNPYPEGFKNVVPTSQFDVLDCYVIFSNKTNGPLKVTFYHKKDSIGIGQDIVVLPEGKAGSSKLEKGMITGFALPIIKWCDKQGTGGVSPKGARIIDVLKHAPVIGFSVTKLKDPVPQKPMIDLPKERANFPSFFYDILTSRDNNGFEVKQSTGMANK